MRIVSSLPLLLLLLPSCGAALAEDDGAADGFDDEEFGDDASGAAAPAFERPPPPTATSSQHEPLDDVKRDTALRWSPSLALTISFLVAGMGVAYLSASKSSEQHAKQQQQRKARLKPRGPPLLNFTLGEGGAGPLEVSGASSEERWSDCAHRYTWVQSSDSIDLRVPLPATTTKKGIRVDFARQALSIFIDGDNVLNGPLEHGVETDASTWFVERSGGDESSGERTLVVSLEKRPRSGKDADAPWSRVVKKKGHPRYGRGAAATDASASAGPSIHTVDPNDPDGVTRLVEQLAAARRARGE